MYLKKIKIGNVELENNIFLAPMAGITDLPFRTVCKQFGPGLTYTEMVSSKALYYNDEKTKKLLKVNEQDRPIAVQIFGSDIQSMEFAANYVSDTADIIDINMGCPAPKVVKNGDGSRLLQNLELLEQIVKVVVKNAKVPVTVKIRKGWNSENIDLVCVNLYPFKETVLKPGVTHEEIIENIDIGGPSMLRSASKNYQSIPVLCDPKDYDKVLEEIRENQETTLETRERLAAKVFRHTARYDAMIADYLTKKTHEEFPESMTITFDKVQDLRYGENPHQKAAFYKGMNPQYSLANATQLHGKELSYNNIQDGNAAIEILKDFEGQYAAVGVKHMNPCGVGIGENIEAAWDKAYEADSISIFGGIVALNAKVEKGLAEKLSKIFLEIIIAPDFSDEALEILTRKKNIRLMKLDTSLSVSSALKYTNVNDGLLVQEMDQHTINEEDLKCVTNRKPTEEEIKQLLFG